MARVQSRRGAFRPSVEPLENRLQPGSLLGADSLAIDLSTNSALDAPNAEVRPILRRPAIRNDISAEPVSVVSPSAPFRNVAAPVVMPDATALMSELQVNPIAANEKIVTQHSGPLPTRVLTGTTSSVPLLTQIDTGYGAVDSVVNDESGPGSDPRLFGHWASYVGGAGDDALSKVTILGTGHVAAMYAVGWATDQADGQTTRLKVIRTPYDSVNPPKVYQTPSSPGNDARGLAIDLAHTETQSSGSVVVGGYKTVNGVQHMLIQSLKSDLSTVNWTVTSDQPSVVYGLKATMPGGAVYFTGAVNGNLLVGKIDAATGSVIFSKTFSFTDRRGKPLASAGNGIGVETTGRASVAMKFTSINGNELPGFAKVTQDGQAVVAHTYNSIGLGGTLNSVHVDGIGNAFYVGTTYATQELHDGYSYLMVNKIAPDGQTQLYSYLYTLRNRIGQHVYNWVGNDIEVDPFGNAVMATTYDDGKDLGNSYAQWIFKIDATEGKKLDQGDGGIIGTKNEFAYGLAMDWSGNVWTVGKTSSPDLPVNGFQTTYAGDPNDGWIARLTTV